MSFGVKGLINKNNGNSCINAGTAGNTETG
jgi:hypothetical protein